MLALYSLLMRLAQPFMRTRLQRRALAEPGYAQGIEERFGRYAPEAASDLPVPAFIWVHAVSLGETRAAAILVAQLRQKLPGMRLLLTHGTATGRAQGAALLQAGDAQVWQPWDTPGAANRFLRHFKPRIGILMETEVWPNMVAACRQQQIPLVLANARLSDKSLRQSLQLAWLARPAYRALTAVWAQTQADADRLKQLDAPVAGVLGNLKFDATPNPLQLEKGRVWRAQFGRPVVLFASSREGEEAALLALLKDTPEQTRNQVQWLIVPRHPQRFDEVAALVAAHGFAVSRRSHWGDALPDSVDAPAGETAGETAGCVWLGDSLGEMALYYGLASVALLGGSFEPLGGQNLIEAAACGCPVVMGPHTFNFAEAAQLSQAAGAALRVPGLAEGVALALSLAADAEKLQAARAGADVFSAAHRGATAKLVQAIDNILANPRLPNKDLS
jgi:3-deoxy-D-manno-octulosonic-acid transferase